MLPPSLLDRSDVKMVYDSQGVKREVLISYEKFQQIAEFIERHVYFYSENVQGRLKKSEDDLQAGRYYEVAASEIDKALEWLDG